MYPNWHQSYLEKDFLMDPYLKVGYSENGEDDVIRNFFWEDIMDRKECIYLDIGCFREDMFSNTKLLSLMGWRGIVLDANPDLSESWIKARKNDIFINRCIKRNDDEEQSMNFYRFDHRSCSTSSLERAKKLVIHGYEMMDIIKVESITLKELGKLSIELIKNDIDFISIDLEYLDYLIDLPDFIRITKPRLFCMEKIDPYINIMNIMHSDEVRTLSKVDYQPISLIGENIFFSPI